MGRATSHTRKDYQTLFELENVLAELENVIVELTTVLSDIGSLKHYQHSRFRVYPQDVGTTVQLTSAAVANTFGDWVKIVPENTITFIFHIVGIIVEELDSTTTYHIQLGYNPGAGEPEENQEMGERRMRFAVSPVSKVSEILEIRSQDMPAYSSVWGRIKTAGGASETLNLSLVLTRHIPVTQEKPLWPTFPW